MNTSRKVGKRRPRNSLKSHRRTIRDHTSTYKRLMQGCPSLEQVFRLVVKKLWISPQNENTPEKTYGGSTSNALDIFWITGFGALTAEDYAQFLLHELTHQLLFIDECCEPFFDYSKLSDVNAPQTYSAILRKVRPLDKAFHSIVVATEILLARQSVLPEVPWIKIHPKNNT